MKKIYLTEQQFNYIVEQQMLNEGAIRNLYQRLFGQCHSSDDIIRRVMGLVTAGIITFSVAVDIINNSRGSVLSNEEATEIVSQLGQQAPKEEWVEVCNDAIVTVYNAKPSQCNADVEHTASMFKLNLKNVGAHKIVAMERTFMKELGLKYGDVIKIIGTHKGIFDGVYQIQDTMNKRFAGQHKIDILVPNNITHGGTWPGQFAKVYVLNDKSDSQKYLDLMAPQKGKR